MLGTGCGSDPLVTPRRCAHPPLVPLVGATTAWGHSAPGHPRGGTAVQSPPALCTRSRGCARRARPRAGPWAHAGPGTAGARSSRLWGRGCAPRDVRDSGGGLDGSCSGVTAQAVGWGLGGTVWGVSSGTVAVLEGGAAPSRNPLSFHFHFCRARCPRDVTWDGHCHPWEQAPGTPVARWNGGERGQGAPPPQNVPCPPLLGPHPSPAGPLGLR